MAFACCLVPQHRPSPAQPLHRTWRKGLFTYTRKHARPRAPLRAGLCRHCHRQRGALPPRRDPGHHGADPEAPAHHHHLPQQPGGQHKHWSGLLFPLAAAREVAWEYMYCSQTGGELAHWECFVLCNAMLRASGHVSRSKTTKPCCALYKIARLFAPHPPTTPLCPRWQSMPGSWRPRCLATSRWCTLSTLAARPTTWP